MNSFFSDAWYWVAMSISPDSPETACSFRFTSKSGLSFLKTDGHRQNSLLLSNCWWISNPHLNFSFW